MTADETEHDGGSLFAGLVLAGVVLFVLAVTIGHLVDAEPGSLADWLTAVAATAALLAASYAAIQSHRTVGLELARDRRRDAEAAELRGRAERAEQAEVVGAWVAWQRGRKLSSGGADLDGAVGRWCVLIRNDSALPVYDVEVTTHPPEGGSRTRAASLDVPPGTTRVPFEESGAVGHPDDARPRNTRVSISFRDTAGRRWQRDERGVLRLVGRMSSGEVDGVLPGVSVEAEGVVSETPESERP